MKRRFRITITPNSDWETFFDLRDWTEYHWGMDLENHNVHFRGWTTKGFYLCAGIEVLDKNAKAL